MSLMEIRRKLDAQYGSNSSDIETLLSQLDRTEFIHAYTIAAGNLEVTFKPIILVSHDKKDTLDLGRLVVRITPDARFTIRRDMTSERDAYLSSTQVHPHVSNDANVCLGNGLQLPEALAEDRDIPMFLALTHDFLLQYSTGNPYWRPFLFDPCRKCPKDFDCIFCKCKRCSSHFSNHDCSRCADAGCLNADSIIGATVNIVQENRNDKKASNEKLIEVYYLVKSFEV